MKDRIKIVGMQYTISGWQGIFGFIKLDDIVNVKKEPDNKYDKNALACYINNKKIGYVSKSMNTLVFEGDYVITGIGFYEINAIAVDDIDDDIDLLDTTDGEDFFNEYEEDEFIESFERWKL